MSRDELLGLCGRLAGAPGRVTLKCDPGLAEELRARFPSVTPGYHTNERRWNTVVLDGSIDDDEMGEMVDHSYDLVVGNLSRAERSRWGL